jgi:hypothetical protein
VKSAGELAELREDPRDLLLRAPRLRRVLDAGKHVRQRDEPALGALAQPPLEAAALRVAGVQQPAAGRLEGLDVRAHLALEARVRGRQARDRAQRVLERGVLQHRGVVDEHREDAAVAPHVCDRAIAGQRERPSLRVHVAAVLQRIRERERRIAERLGERGLERARPRLAQVDDEVGDRGRAA